MNDKSKALIYILLSTLSFALMSVTIKYIQTIPVFEKVFFRNLVSLFVALFIILKTRPKKLEDFIGKKENQIFLFSRASLGFLGVVLNFYAITNLKLADSQILNRISPIWVSLFALLFLKEKLTKTQVFSTIIALVGSILVIKPEFNFSKLPALSGFLSSITAGGAYTLVRFLKNRENPSIIIFYFSLLSLVLSIPLMISNFILPTNFEIMILLLTGVFASFGQFGLTHAYKYAPASEVSIYTYTGIIFAIIIGLVLWKEIPDILSMLGGFLIIVSGYIVYKRVKSYSAT
ncbi:DMT family transporter [Thiospirochaeta perfilievii]|uniref:DMT family transporter n=1 Tax=Thiospirochaeta perfilievii TaxID=252967 RepID=A0A5C1QHT8_9SPIO|nr:DMT family transporter [Thiospirochaeta perfilievii]QEN05822.1 DMT family transporter [Thiospirochaeta perfilievii]